MKTLKNFLGLTAILTLLFAFNMQAQTSTSNTEKKHLKGHGNEITNLMEAHKAQTKANREIAKKAQEGFRATLSDEQKAILDNKSFATEQRKSALAKALSPEQKETMKNNALARKEANAKFRKNLTEEQKGELKQLAEKRKNKSVSKVN